MDFFTGENKGGTKTQCYPPREPEADSTAYQQIISFSYLWTYYTPSMSRLTHFENISRGYTDNQSSIVTKTEHISMIFRDHSSLSPYA